VSRLRRIHRDRSRGQSLVEFSVLVPAFMLILFGMLEFGFVFTHNLTLEYATREGARTGAALADGGNNAGVCATIDAQIIAAVERVLTSPGSPIDETAVTTIKIWKSTVSTDPNPGTPLSAAQTSTWNYGTGGAPTVDGFQLHYHETTGSTWTPCTRNNGANPDSIGVSLTYNYSMVTPLSAVARFFGGGASTGIISMADRTVMSLNP
jgi:Flp pilus assembly protein TadG